MKKIILLFTSFILLHTNSFEQVLNDKIIFVVDSIPVIDDPEEGNEILQSDIADLTVIKNKDSLKLLGYGRYDGATFIFTNEYRSRSENIKKIPSSKQMERKDETFLFRNNLYSGEYIDY